MTHSCTALALAKDTMPPSIEISEGEERYRPDPLLIVKIDNGWCLDMGFEYAVTGIKFCPFCGVALQ